MLLPAIIPLKYSELRIFQRHRLLNSFRLLLIVSEFQGCFYLLSPILECSWQLRLYSQPCREWCEFRLKYLGNRALCFIEWSFYNDCGNWFFSDIYKNFSTWSAVFLGNIAHSKIGRASC